MLAKLLSGKTFAWIQIIGGLFGVLEGVGMLVNNEMQQEPELTEGSEETEET